MKKEMMEGFNKMVPFVVATAVLYELSQFAFTTQARKEIGKRDGWTCQYLGCDDGYGRPKSFTNGWMVYASHITTHDKRSNQYNVVETGRIHCIEHEIQFHTDLLLQARSTGDRDQVNFNLASLEKLYQVDQRTYAYRREPSKFD